MKPLPILLHNIQNFYLISRWRNFQWTYHFHLFFWKFLLRKVRWNSRILRRFCGKHCHEFYKHTRSFMIMVQETPKLWNINLKLPDIFFPCQFVFWLITTYYSLCSRKYTVFFPTFQNLLFCYQDIKVITL